MGKERSRRTERDGRREGEEARDQREEGGSKYQAFQGSIRNFFLAMPFLSFFLFFFNCFQANASGTQLLQCTGWFHGSGGLAPPGNWGLVLRLKGTG